MSDIVADAKAWLERRDNQTLRTHSEHCHHVHAECLVARLVAEVERHRMTAEERAMVAGAADDWRLDDGRTIWDYLARTAPPAAS